MMEITDRWSRVIFTIYSIFIYFILTGKIHSAQSIKFRNEPNNITVHKGEKATLKCTIEHLGPRYVVWRRVEDEFPLTIGELIFSAKEEIYINSKKMKNGVVHWDLVIKHADFKHSGKYECQVSSKETISYYVQLTVLDGIGPVNTDGIGSDNTGTTVIGTRFVNLHEPIHLMCASKGRNRAPLDVDWFQEGHKINTGSSQWKNRIEITKYRELSGNVIRSNLTITFSKHGDAGIYVCRSEGSEPASIDVHVLNAPPYKPKQSRDTHSQGYGSDDRSQASVIYPYQWTLLIMQTMIGTFYR